MPADVLARIQAERPDRWTPELVGGLLTAAFRRMPGRGIRVSPTDQLIDLLNRPIELSSIIALSAHCVSDRKEREILLYFARRRATDDGMTHKEAARYYGMSRSGLNLLEKRVLTAFADCLNESGRTPLETLELYGEKATRPSLSSSAA